MLYPRVRHRGRGLGPAAGGGGEGQGKQQSQPHPTFVAAAHACIFRLAVFRSLRLAARQSMEVVRTANMPNTTEKNSSTGPCVACAPTTCAFLADGGRATRQSKATHDAFGNIGTIFWELEWKTPDVSPENAAENSKP